MPEEQTVPMWTYDQTRDIYEKARLSPVFKDMSLPAFAAAANEITGTQQFAMGLSDTVLKQLNYKVNQASTAVANMAGLGSLGAGAMEMVGLPQHADIGRRIGEMLPRGVAETAMLFAGGGTTAAARAAGWGARLLGAGSQGAQMYSATDSGKAGLFGGLTSLAMPPTVRAAEAMVPKLFGKSLGLAPKATAEVVGAGTSQVPLMAGAQTATQRVGQKTLEATARNLAFLGFGETQLQGSQLLATGQLMPYTDEHLVELVASQVAFAPLDLLGITRSRVATRTEQIVAQATKREQGALDQRINAAVDEVKRGGPVGPRTEALLETLDKAEQESVRRTIGITRSRVTRALQTQEGFDLADVSTYRTPFGRKPLRGKNLEAVQSTIDELVHVGFIRLDGTKVVPLKKFDLKGQLNLLDHTGEAQAVTRMQREQQAAVAAKAVLEMEVVPKGEAKGAQIAEGVEPPWRKREEGEPVGPEGDIKTQPWRQAELKASPEAPAEAAITTAQRAFKILSTPGGAKDFARQMNQYDTTMSMEGVVYTEMDARKWLVEAAKPAVQEAWKGVSAEAKAELDRMSQLARATAEPVGKPVVKKPLVTEKGEAKPEGYKGPMLQKEVAEPTLVDAAQYQNIKDVASAQAWLNAFWTKVWRKVQGYEKRQVTKDVEVETPTGETTTKRVTNTETVLARKEGTENVNLLSIHNIGIDLAIKRLEQLGIKAERSEFSDPPVPDLLAAAVGWDAARPSVQGVVDRLGAVVQMIGDWYDIKAERLEDLVTDPETMVKPDVTQQIELADARIEQQLAEAYRLAEVDPGLKNSLWQAEGEWQHTMDQITSVRRPASELLERVRNAMLQRVKTLDAVLKDRSQELVAHALERMAQTTQRNASSELGVPQARMDEVMRVLDEYDRKTVQRIEVKDADGKKIIKTTRGPIVQELLRVLYTEETIKRTFKGGGNKTHTPSNMLNTLAAYRIMEWGARLVQGLQAHEDARAGKEVRLAPEANLFTKYADLVTKERGGLEEYKPASREAFVHDVAREALFDLIMIPQRKRSKYGEASPAWQQYDVEGKTKWWQNDSDAYALAVADTEHAMSGSEAEAFTDVTPYDQAAYEAAIQGKGGTVKAGTEMDAFFKRVVGRVAAGFKFDTKAIKGLPLVRVVFNEDGTLNRGRSAESTIQKSLSDAQAEQMAKELNATLEIVRDYETYGFQLRQEAFEVGGGDKQNALQLVLVPRTLANGLSEGMTAAQWRVLDKVGMLSPELRATHAFLTRGDSTIADYVQGIREVAQSEDADAAAKITALKPLAKVLADNEVARVQGKQRKAAETAMSEEERSAVRQQFMKGFVDDWEKFVNEKGPGRWFFKKYIDKLQQDYTEGVKSSYKNFRNLRLPRVMEALAAQEFKATKAVGAEIGRGKAKTADERTAAEVLLDEAATEGQLEAGLWGHFHDHFTKLGAPAGQATFLANVAAKVGAAFPKLQHGTIVDLVDSRYAGIHVAQTSRKYLVGLNPAVFDKLPVGEKAAMMFHFAAHEIAHGLYSDLATINQLTAEQIAARRQNVLWAQTLGPEGRRAVLAQAFYAVLPIVKKPQLWGDVKIRFDVAAENPEEFLVDLAGLSVLGLASPDPKAKGAVAANYLMSEAHVQSVLKSVFVPLLDVAQPLAEYFERRLPNKEVAAQFQRLVQGTREVLNTTTDEIDRQFSRLLQLQQSEPALFYEAVAKGYRPDAALLGPDETKVFEHYAQIGLERSKTAEDAVRVAAGALWGVDKAYESAGGGREVPMPIRWFFTAGQLAQKYPVLRPMFQLAFRYFGDANAASQKIMGHMLRKRRWVGTDVIDYEATGLTRVLEDANVREAFDDIALLKQGNIEAGEARRVLSDAEMVAVAERHGVRSKEDQLAIINLHKNFEIAAPKIREHTINMLVDILGVRMLGSRLMQLDPMMAPDTAIARAHELALKVWQEVDGGTPAGLDAAQADLVKPLLTALAPLKEFADKTNDTPEAWMPEVRMGKWKIAYWEKRSDGKWYGGVQSAANKVEREAKIAALQKRAAADRDHAEPGQVVGIKAWDAWTKREDTNQGQPMWSLLHNMATGSLQKRLFDAGVTDPALHAKIFDDNWSPITSAMEAAEARDVSRMTKERKLRPGRETLNMAQGFLHQASHIPRALSQMYADAEASLRLDAPELRGEGALRELARKHYRNVVHPQAAELTSLKKFIFAYFMGFNVSSILIEPTQQFIALLPSLTRDTGSATGAMKMWGRATALAIRRARHGGKSGDADFDAALDKANARQVTDFGTTQELYNAEDYGALNVASALSAGKPLWNAKRLATSAFDAYVNGARRFYGVAPMVNNVLAFSAAYLTARDHGVFEHGTGRLRKLSGDEAWNYAAGVTQATMGGGGIASRPVELFSNKGQVTGVVGAMYSLATYSMLMLSHVARLGIDTVNRRGDLSPLERKAAMKALGQTLLTQTAFAGALGLPMATGALAVLEQFFPGLKANEAVQDTVQKLVGEDDEMGGFFTDLVMRGVPNALLGVDTSSRLQLSNVLGVSQYDGFKIENLLGPTGSIVGNAFRAMQDAQRGRIADGVERLLPTAFKNIVQMYRDGWVSKDWKGQPLYEPSGTELALQLVGLRPNALTKLRDAQKMAKRSTEVARAEGGQFTDKLAQWLVDGETQKVQQALLDRERTVVGYSAVEGARTVAEKATKMLFPMDFAREGVRVDAPTRQKLALAGGVRATPETKWLETKKRLEGLLGVPGGGQISRSELMVAQLVDQLRAQNPLLSVQEAREQAQIALGRRASQGLLGAPQAFR